jgi:hypothetical protein
LGLRIHTQKRPRWRFDHGAVDHEPRFALHNHIDPLLPSPILQLGVARHDVAGALGREERHAHDVCAQRMSDRTPSDAGATPVDPLDLIERQRRPSFA